MKRIITFTLSVILAIAAVAVHAETRQETKTRLSVISKQCAEAPARSFDFSDEARKVSDCLRIGSLRDDLIRCATERHHLRRAAACPHDWHGIGPKVKGCSKCESIAHFVNGEWLVVLADGIWVGPEPMDYPEDYGLR
ncbi:MAG: hypothetical protein M0T69_02195 [Deltaproteobacteria bacterium]|nr:hypothetical protein [Deltaproteobacteria bacterium]